MNATQIPNRRHGSPYDRGSADRYYGRPYSPHFYNSTFGSIRVNSVNMTIEQLEEYRKGWDSEENRKDYY